MPAARACACGWAGSQPGSSGSTATDTDPCSPCHCVPGPSAHAAADDADGACEGDEVAPPSGSGTCSSQTHAHPPPCQAGAGMVSRRVRVMEEARDGGGDGGQSRALAAMNAAQQPAGGTVVKVLQLSVAHSPMAQLPPWSSRACSLVPSSGEPRVSQRMPLAAAPAVSSHRGTQQQPSPWRTSGGSGKENCGTAACSMLPRMPAAGSPRAVPGGARSCSPPGREQGCSTHASASGCTQQLSGCGSIAATSTSPPSPTCSWHAAAMSSPSAPGTAEPGQLASPLAHGSRNELAGEQLAVSLAAAAATGGAGPSGNLVSQPHAPRWLQAAREQLQAHKTALAAVSARAHAQLTRGLAEQAAVLRRMRALRAVPLAMQGHAPTTTTT